ncbi:MAG TPA: hypothetical protein PLS49_07445, partial [Candidatus Woesebacteria bacterium]|nr:hypothetical protein [Candidatus Woesebacteria bacterium]
SEECSSLATTHFTIIKGIRTMYEIVIRGERPLNGRQVSLLKAEGFQVISQTLLPIANLDSPSSDTRFIGLPGSTGIVQILQELQPNTIVFILTNNKPFQELVMRRIDDVVYIAYIGRRNMGFTQMLYVELQETIRFTRSSNALSKIDDVFDRIKHNSAPHFEYFQPSNHNVAYDELRLKIGWNWRTDRR